jgi:hypothetical protein
MLLSIIIIKSVIELSLAFIAGRFLLGVLIGGRRDGNVFWQLLDVAAQPALRLTRRISPKVVPDRHIPLTAMLWLLLAWVIVLQLKMGVCLAAGFNACR